MLGEDGVSGLLQQTLRWLLRLRLGLWKAVPLREGAGVKGKTFKLGGTTYVLVPTLSVDRLGKAGPWQVRACLHVTVGVGVGLLA